MYYTLQAGKNTEMLLLLLAVVQELHFIKVLTVETIGQKLIKDYLGQIKEK